jgi:hypothetical protein
MSHEAIRAIDSLKPYGGPDGNDPLWRIHRFDNINKHRTLFTVGRERIYTAEWMSPLGVDGGFRIPASEPDFSGFFDSQFEQDMDLALTETFANAQIGQGDALIPSLQELVDFVHRLVESFVPLLDGDQASRGL